MDPHFLGAGRELEHVSSWSLAVCRLSRSQGDNGQVAEISSESSIAHHSAWNQVKSAQLIEICLAAVRKVCWAEGQRVSQKSLALAETLKDLWGLKLFQAKEATQLKFIIQEHENQPYETRNSSGRKTLVMKQEFGPRHPGHESADISVTKASG